MWVQGNLAATGGQQHGLSVPARTLGLEGANEWNTIGDREINIGSFLYMKSRRSFRKCHKIYNMRNCVTLFKIGDEY
jgi:hypothetical protein